MLDVLHEPRFVDLAPAEVYATLLDERRYLCSERTMYRILAAGNPSTTRPPGARPEDPPETSEDGDDDDEDDETGDGS